VAKPHELIGIGEFARRVRLSVKQLRSYNELGLLAPAYVDPDSGYRYYHRGQARTAITIALLRSLDVPLSDVHELLVADEPQSVALLEDDRFYFIEMNTRLQVEHGITEMVTGADLVREQLRVAAGERLELSQDDVRPNGSSVEFRVNAEDPERDFQPAPGRIESLELPGGPGVRIDTAIYPGYAVPPFYDSLIAKLMVWAPTREQALRRGRRALEELRIEGVATTIPLHLRLVEDEHVVAGDVHTGYLEELLASPQAVGETA
jgi:biotin carboxylase